MKKGTRHEWRERMPDGEFRYRRAIHFGAEWDFAERFKDDEEYTPLDPVPLSAIRALHERLLQKYTRHRLAWKTVEKVEAMVENHPDIAFRKPLLLLLSDYAERHPEEKVAIARYRDFVLDFEDCFERSQEAGHVTGSAWIIDPSRTRVLLTHHRKLNRWLQPGGHADGVADVLQVALTEAREETGLPEFETLGEGIFDLDIHGIPARGDDPSHFHYDARFLLLAQSSDYIVSEESHDLAWVRLEDLESYTEEDSMLRMRDKSLLHLR